MFSPWLAAATLAHELWCAAMGGIFKTRGIMRGEWKKVVFVEERRREVGANGRVTQPGTGARSFLAFSDVTAKVFVPCSRHHHITSQNDVLFSLPVMITMLFPAPILHTVTLHTAHANNVCTHQLFRVWPSIQCCFWDHARHLDNKAGDWGIGEHRSACRTRAMFNVFQDLCGGARAV